MNSGPAGLLQGGILHRTSRHRHKNTINDDGQQKCRFLKRQQPALPKWGLHYMRGPCENVCVHDKGCRSGHLHDYSIFYTALIA